jgi:hypothetical protein
MTDQNENNAPPQEASKVEIPQVETPAPEEKSPTQLAREAELADISEMFKLEEKPADENSEETPKTPKPDAPADEKKEEPTIAPAPSPAADGKPKEEATPPQTADLKGLLADVLKEMKGTEEKPEEKKADAPPPPKYMPQIPDAIFAGLEHEDPAIRRQAMNAMIGGAMSKVYSDLTAEINARVTEAVSQVPTMVEQSAQQKASLAKTREEFYAENPEFAAKGEKFQKFVAMAGIQYAQSLGAEYKGFTPEFRVKLAKHIEEMTGGAVKAGKVPAKKPASEVKAPKVANGYQAGNAPTRAPEAGAMSLSDEIADTLGITVN